MFVKGQAPPPGSGRPKGALSRRTLARLDAAETLSSLKFDPIKEMVKLFKKPNQTDEIKVRLSVELAGFVYPKLRSIEHIVQAQKRGTTTLFEALGVLAAEAAKVRGETVQ